HCKNVVTKQAPMNRAERKRQEQHGRVFRVLTVTTKTTRKPLTGAHLYSSEQGSHARAHWVRGHFAHYTAEAPLFGKYTGQFWHPAHVRGNKDIGTVEK